MASALDQQIAYAEAGDDQFSLVTVLKALRDEKVALQQPVDLAPLEGRVKSIEDKLAAVDKAITPAPAK